MGPEAQELLHTEESGPSAELAQGQFVSSLCDFGHACQSRGFYGTPVAGSGRRHGRASESCGRRTKGEGLAGCLGAGEGELPAAVWEPGQLWGLAWARAVLPESEAPQPCNDNLGVGLTLESQKRG